MKGVLRGLLIRKLFALPSLFVSLYSSLHALLGYFVNYFFRAEEEDRVSSYEFDGKDDGIEQCDQPEDSPKLFFSFKYQTYREDTTPYVLDDCDVSESIDEEESIDLDACFQKVDLVKKEFHPAEENLVEPPLALQNHFNTVSDGEVDKEFGESNALIETLEVYKRVEIKERESDSVGKSEMEEIKEVEKRVLVEVETSESVIEEVIEMKENAPQIIAEKISGYSEEDPDLGNELMASNNDEFSSENDFRGDVAEDFDPFESDEESSDILWEQQELMEQMKIDMKKAKATGLPTIEEEDEYPNEHEVFSPWGINENFRHEDRISELRKFYRIYKQRMRKLDILNFQKRIAFGCLQSKLLKEDTNRRGSFSIRKRRVSDSDSVRNAINEILEEFEGIYVAHTCLSWEILHWQYIKMVELWGTDKLRIRSYNEAAKEYQQFQVLLERFVENEAFDGPRIENYTNKRCSSQKLLQIPMIREDRSKDRKMGEDSIKSDLLIEVMEGAIRTMWKFIKADTSGQGSSISDDPSVTEIRSILAKKEKRLKEVAKSGSKWMVWKRQDEKREDVAYFFAEVEMKLVSRVLRMSKVTREQVEWCKSKLDNIDFVGEKMCSQSSFCFFPC